MFWIGLASLFVAVVLAYRCKCHSEIGPAEGIRLPVRTLADENVVCADKTQENETGTPTPMDEKTSSQAARVDAIRAQADADRCHQG
jgi:hypothetical protein